ncbi:MAG: hypothetical protein LBP30_07095 [Clostridiales Family XIII bacterium]|jgi:hypothetical protein|nr:hypothetical protein [Clostridiales Family XIII bacterium]
MADYQKAKTKKLQKSCPGNFSLAVDHTVKGWYTELRHALFIVNIQQYEVVSGEEIMP